MFFLCFFSQISTVAQTFYLDRLFFANVKNQQQSGEKYSSKIRKKILAQSEELDFVLARSAEDSARTLVG